MKTFCNYHPTKPARWHCLDCDVTYCQDCITEREIDQYGTKKTFYYCPKCNQFPQRLAIGNIVEPFWNRLHKFFTYPFHPRPLSLMIGFSLASFLFWIPLAGWLLSIVVYVALLKYSFVALVNTAQGKFSPPQVEPETIFSDTGVVFKQIGLFIILGIAFVVVTSVAGPLVGVLFLCFAILCIPSMIILLVSTNSLVHAINPSLFVTMPWRIGWGYLLMYFFLILFSGAPAALGKYVIPHLPTVTHLMLMTFLNSYYTIISYQLMGYVILQYHEQIGYQVETDDETLVYEDGTAGEGEGSKIAKRVDVLIKGGNIDEAIAAIREETEGEITDPELAERYFNLLKIKDRVEEMLEHGKHYLEILAKANKKKALCEVYLECTSKNTGFAPAPATLIKIAGSLNETGRPKEAVQAYNRFIKANPKSPLVPKAYFLGSNIINEKFKNPQKASTILKGLIKKYPDNEIIPYAERYLKQMNMP